MRASNAKPRTFRFVREVCSRQREFSTRRRSVKKTENARNRKKEKKRESERKSKFREHDSAQPALNSGRGARRASKPSERGTPSSMSASLLNLLLVADRVRKHPFQLPTASFCGASVEGATEAESDHVAREYSSTSLFLLSLSLSLRSKREKIHMVGRSIAAGVSRSNRFLSRLAVREWKRSELPRVRRTDRSQQRETQARSPRSQILSQFSSTLRSWT